ncbi:MAG: branched-chain amino acid ABC transporter permease, partial [Anaerolineae bacterium]
LGFKRMTALRFGRALKCIRENELAAESIGIDVTMHKIKAIVVGCASAGAAGCLVTHLNGFVGPDSFTFWNSIILLVMVTIGGLGSFGGAVSGAIFVTLADEVFRGFAAWRALIYGGLILVFMIFLPNGLAGLGSILGPIARSWLSRVTPAPDTLQQAVEEAAGEEVR